MTDAQARARVWTLCLAALVLCALTSPVAALLTPLAHASAPALNIVAAILRARPQHRGRDPRRRPRRCVCGPRHPAHRRRPARRAAPSARPPLVR